MSRRIIVVMLALLLLVAGGAAALRYAATVLKSQVEAALGAESAVASIAVEGHTVVVRGIVIRAPASWPTPEALRAESIVITPDLAALMSGDVKVSRIIAERVYLAAVRPRGGELELLPSLLEKPKDTPGSDASSGTQVTIDRIEIRDGVIELYDGDVRRTPHRTRIENVEAAVGPLSFPALDATTRVDVAGFIKGPARDGTASIQGDIRLSDLDSKLSLVLRGIDLVALEPYLLASNETGVKRGELDLKIESTVAERRLTAPGTMTLSNLELTGSTFMGMSRKAVVAALKGRQDTITIRFNLDGSLDDPHFLLRENLATRAGTAVAEGLGLGVRGLAETLGSVTQSVTKKLGELLHH